MGVLAGSVVGRPSWTLSLYAEAGEAGGCWRVPSGAGVSGRPSDPDRSAEEAVRRARGMIRRYCAANRLNRLGTLTYAGAGCHDPAVVRADAGGFFRRLRASWAGRRSRICGCRSGIRAGMGCICTSRSAGM